MGHYSASGLTYDNVSLQLASNVRSLANKRRASKIWYLLRYPIFNQKPYVVAGDGCSLASVREGSYWDCGRGVYSFVADKEFKIVFSL